MTERLFGMETEYGFAVRPGAPPGPGRDWGDRFITLAAECLRHLRSSEGSGMFLPNGARLYLDCGHPEMTTPECANPWDVVRYMQAGERMLSAVAQELKKREPGVVDVLLFKTNVSHGDVSSTWGCHTSFLHRASPALLPRQIIPHLVSRIIYSGCGGVERSSSGLRFVLSPRVAFLEKEISGKSTGERGIFHTKDESLSAEGYHRLHIICGESLFSESALWLNIGATALIVAMIEAGLSPGEDVQLADALGAMRVFARDPTCSKRVPTATGRPLSAVQIQRHYLEMAEAQLAHCCMPPWAERVCVEWRAMLDRLENGAPASVARTLDWAIKFCLFGRQAERRGLDWNPAQTKQEPTEPGPGLQPTTARSRESRVLLDLHQELCEIDTRFGQLGPEGIFAALDRAGALAHHFPGVDNIEHAMVEPPAIGRARLRGQCVHRFARQSARYACGWKGVWDREKNLLIDLSDPFATEEKWQALPRGYRGLPDSLQEHVRHLLLQVLTLHDRGSYEAASEVLCELEVFQPTFDSRSHYEFKRLVAWVQSRRGFLDGLSALDELARSRPLDLSLITDYVCAYRHQGLSPPAAIESWIEKGLALLEQDGAPDSATAVPFLGHYGYLLLRSGRPKEALRVFQDACLRRSRAQAHPHSSSRILAELADVHRALGQREEASLFLDEAQREQVAHGFEGDLADLTLTYRAKLEPDHNRARGLLAEVRTMQTRLQNSMGQTRTLLLEARLGRNPDAAALQKPKILELGRQLPALDRCKMLSKILSHWNLWAGGAPDPDGGADFYWWL